MTHGWTSYPKRFFRWLFGGPFRSLPPPFGSPVPTDMQVFEAQAEDAEHQGLGGVAGRVPASHEKTRPARQDPSLERQ